MTGTMKSSLASVLQPPKIRRKHLRKYSWLPDVFRIKGSILYRIWGPVLTVTIWAALVCYAWYRGLRVTLTNGVVPLLSVVVGLILVFRNGTSYDRFWEGRKSFSTVTACVRNIARQLWVNTALPPTDNQPAHAKGKTPTTDVTAHQLQRMKVEALHLALAFPFAVKHYLRGEDGTNYPDLHSVLPPTFARFDEVGYNTTRKSGMSSSYSAVPNLSKPASVTNLSGRSSPDATKRVRPKRSKPDMASSATPLLSSTHRSVEFHPFADEASLPLPLAIAHELSAILYQFRREGFLETIGPAGTNAIAQTISKMVDELTNMERVANTPIPISYGIHLKQVVTLYLFALPFTLVQELGWGTIPIVTVVAFTFMGIEGIAEEIEMPFGNDPCDLPLDRYCQDLKEEIEYMIERLPSGREGAHGYDDGEGDD